MVQRRDEVTAPAVRAGLARARHLVADAARRSGREAGDVTIVAVVKYVDVAACALLAREGVLDLAESRLDQLVARQEDPRLGDDVRWHFIGRLQSRDAPSVAARCRLVHTLAGVRAARRIQASGASPQLLVQVNVDGDPAKDGVRPGEVERLLVELPEELSVAGLMAMPAATDDPERSRGACSALRELRDHLAPRVEGRHDLRLLSMGTSQDFQVAVEEGATHVRLGRTLYAATE